MPSTSNDHRARLERILRDAGHEEPIEVLRALAMLFAVFPDRNGGHTPERWEGYVEALADLPLRALQWACSDAMRTSRFLPAPAEIRERVAEAVTTASGVLGAQRAWSRVMIAVGKHGTASLPPGGFGDPIADEVMSPALWRQLGQTDAEMIPSERKAFVDAYRAAERRARLRVQRGQLAPPAVSTIEGTQAGRLIAEVAGALGKDERRQAPASRPTPAAPARDSDAG